VPELVEQLLAAACRAGASDVHLLPDPAGLHMLWRIDGVLQPIAVFPPELSSRIIGRLKVLARLLTYQNDVPQEGRIQDGSRDLEMRVSTFPTLHGEKVVVRLFVGSGRYCTLRELGLAPEILETLRRLLQETGGVILLTGPAGSGKTTTIYACLRELVGTAPTHRSLVTLEDPIEAVVAGVSQSQVNLVAGFDMPTGLRSLVRQDPDVLMVGEIRDRATAETVFQASLTGHLVLTTFHAGSAAATISRLSDMGIEPYLLRSGVLGIICQRLLRRLCECAESSDDPAGRLGLPVERYRLPVGCAQCGGTGYHGRFSIAEMLLPEPSELGRAILSRSDAAQLEELAVQAGMITRWRRAAAAIRDGWTSPAEVRRVLGFTSGH
jgi:type II secretory ATPase GspE/PulE/Tfp pilus assembly ATPase PilB-like protein